MSQQLVKKGTNGKHENVMPKSWIEAIKDKNTGQTLVKILQGFNMYFLSYNGNTSATRNMIPSTLRRKGLWISYVKYDGNVYTEWYAANEIDDKSWGNSSNWRVGNNTLVGDITISANGNWVINGTETEFKAVGEKGNTPLIRVANNRLQVSYDLGDTYRDVTNNPVYTKFRWLATSGDTQANNVGRIQASTNEGKTWTNMSNDFINNLHISRYIGVSESLPTNGIAEGTIYAKGPYYAEGDTLNDNPIYRLWVYAWKDNTLAWQDNGEFTSVTAGIVQERGTSITEVMSQDAVTREIDNLHLKIENNQVVVKDLPYRKIIQNYKIMNNGSIIEATGMEIALYKVEPYKSYKIFNNIIGSAETPSYAIYSSEELNENTLIVAGEPINLKKENTYITTSDSAKYIAIQRYRSTSSVSETQNIQEAIPAINNDIQNLQSDKEGYGVLINTISFIPGYIYYDGSIAEGGFTTYLYPVNPNTNYFVYSALRSGISRMYAVYSSNELSADTVLSIGVGVSDDREDSVLITTPENAAYIAISTYKESAHAVYLTKKISLRETEKEVQTLKNSISSFSSSSTKKTACTLDNDGENLYIAYLDESYTEYVYWFKKCMFNELYTFYRVGYRKVDRGYPSTEGINLLTGITIINKTSSDNIGPILFKNGRWSGGNHSWNSDNVTKTARTESYAIYADGVEIKAGESKYADKVVVKVVNTIFNPAVLPSSIVPISTESVDYSVVKNTIEVSVKQQFADINNPVDRYYGMQSMFENEQKLLIPNGGVDEWIDTPSDYFIEKSLYPKVNRFIERNDSIGFQSTYLKPNKDGNHQMVATTIFNHSYSKSYHYIIDGETNVAGKKVVWSGAYSFFNKPIQDDSNVFVYSGVINGKDAVYINTKKAFEGSIELPSKYLMKKIQVIEKDDTISTTNEFVDSEGIEINASGTGSMIVLLD